MKGMNFGFAAPRGWYGSPEGLAQISKMKALNIDWVAPHVTFVQHSYASTRVFMDFVRTPGDAEVLTWCRAAREAGLKVMLKPILEPMDGSWRGMITQPPDRDNSECTELVTQSCLRSTWQKSFCQAVMHYARLAVEAEVECFCMGAEYEQVERYGEMWEKLIPEVREIYSGLLTYEFTPGNVSLRKIRPGVGDWWGLLDFLGFSAYGDNKTEEAPIEDFVEGLQARKEEAAGLSRELGLPLALLETGRRSTRGLKGPAHDFMAQGRYDGEIQARYMEAVHQAFSKEDWFRGFLWWKWDEHQGDARPNYYTDPAGDQGFTIDGKPAAETMRRLYAQ